MPTRAISDKEEPGSTTNRKTGSASRLSPLTPQQGAQSTHWTAAARARPGGKAGSAALKAAAWLLTTLAWALADTAAAQLPSPGDAAPREKDEERVEIDADVEPAARDAALPDRPLMLRAGASFGWDSNIFRQPSAREERIRSGYIGLRVDKVYAQQRVRLDVTETAYRYHNFRHLDFNALDYIGAWTWHLGPRIEGSLSASRAESLADYSELSNPGELNVRTTENFLASADAWLFGGWHLVGGLSGVQDRYSVPTPHQGSYRADGVEAGARWVAPSENWLAFKLRSLEGRYTDRALDPVALIDDGFQRRETEALAAWRFTGKSSLDARAAWIDYRSNHFAERDFSGIAARLRYLWAATARISLSVQFNREMEPWQDDAASHRVENRLTLGAAWQPAARTTLSVDASRAASDFRDPVPGFTGTPRNDLEHRLQVQAEWRALRKLSLNAAAQRYRRSSSDPAANYRGSQFTAGASLLF